MEKIRVIQWATGSVGQEMVRLVSKKLDLEIVGAIVHSPQKVGKDLAEIVGLKKRLGIIASNNADEVLNQIEADVVLIATPASSYYEGSLSRNVEEIAKALNTKKNVITITGFMYPWRQFPEIAHQFDALAKENGVTLLGTGINPGFLFDFFPLSLTGAMERVDKIFMRDCEDLIGYSLDIMQGMLGFGLRPEEFDNKVAEPLRRFLTELYCECMYFIADSLGWELSRINTKVETSTAKERLAAGCMQIEPGTVCLARFLGEATMGEEVVITMEAVIKVCPDKVTEGGDIGQSYRIEGSPSISLDIKKGFTENTVLTTAAHAVNAIKHVVNAPPGFLSLKDLPLVTAIA